MEHVFLNTDKLPMHYIVNIKEKQLSFVSDDLVMAGDVVSGPAIGIKGTIKEILQESESKGCWPKRKTKPTNYKVQLY